MSGRAADFGTANPWPRLACPEALLLQANVLCRLAVHVNSLSLPCDMSQPASEAGQRDDDGAGKGAGEVGGSKVTRGDGGRGDGTRAVRPKGPRAALQARTELSALLAGCNR
jgi:hypothetical protein